MLTIDFTGRRAAVTGGASGIGLAIARHLRGCGAQVTLCDLDASALADAGHNFAAEQLDVTDAKGVKALAAKLDIDLLVVAAGLLQRPAKTDRLTDNEWSRVNDVNLRGAYLTMARFGEQMAARGRGSILAIASVTAYAGTPLHAYGPAKAAMVNLVQGLAAEWATRGVRVNALAPGFTRTPALERGLAHALLDEKRLADSAAMRRLVETDEIAAAGCFLLSDLASGITGATLPVDCGLLATAGFAPFGGHPS
jgi:NAD(P)-dependent dehydrogenase (short-subunit alcohol dehydrogenase family)